MLIHFGLKQKKCFKIYEVIISNICKLTFSGSSQDAAFSRKSKILTARFWCWQHFDKKILTKQSGKFCNRSDLFHWNIEEVNLIFKNILYLTGFVGDLWFLHSYLSWIVQKCSSLTMDISAFKYLRLIVSYATKMRSQGSH